MKVFSVLKADVGHRQNVSAAPLYDLESLSHRVYHGKELILNGRSKYAIPQNVYPDNETFKKMFYEKYSIFEGVDLTNLYIAGGAVSQFVGTGFKSEDIDVFVYGIMSEAAASQRVVKFMNDIRINYIKFAIVKSARNNKYNRITQIQAAILDAVFRKMDNTNISVREECNPQYICVFTKPEAVAPSQWEQFQTILTTQDPNYMAHTTDSINQAVIVVPKINYTSVITAYSTTAEFQINKGPESYENIKIQVISRLYTSIQQILYGFDLGSCAIGFDGEKVQLSLCGKFTYDYNMNILDTTRFSSNHASRLKKYYDRGFGIIFPNFNMDTISSDNCAKGYQQSVSFCGMKFTWSNINNPMIRPQKYVVGMVHYGNNNSDYGPISDNPSTKAAVVNDHLYLKNTMYKLVNGLGGFYTHGSYNCLDDFASTMSTIPNFDIKAITKIYMFLHYEIWNNGLLDIKKVTSYLPGLDIVDFIQKITSKLGYAHSMLKQSAYEHRLKVIDRIATINPADHIGIKWVTSDPMTQRSLLTGSFNPVSCDDRKFYTEKYYRDNNPEVNKFIASTISVASAPPNSTISAAVDGASLRTGLIATSMPNNDTGYRTTCTICYSATGGGGAAKQ